MSSLECGLTDSSPLDVMEGMMLTSMTRVTNKNLGSLLHPASLLADEVNCNQKTGLTWPEALPIVMMNIKAAVQRTVGLQTR